jgi:hypothetical protein
MKSGKSASPIQTILVAGSKEIQNNFEEKSLLAKQIGAKIMHIDNWILLNGGALGVGVSDENPRTIDHLVCIGAQEELKIIGGSVTERILTLHPKQSNHPLHTIGRVEVTKRQTPAFRRFDLVARADAIITIEGVTGTKEIIELGMALEKPVLPIPCTGGRSKDAWDEYESDILHMFRISKTSTQYELLNKGLNIPLKVSELIINLIHDKLKPACFVAMPLRKEFDCIYHEAIVPALLKSGYNTIRADHILQTGNIIEQIIEFVRKSSICLADITDLNPNVMYELGMADMLGKPVILISQSGDNGRFKDKPPFDISVKRIIKYDVSSLGKLLNEIYALTQNIR